MLTSAESAAHGARLAKVEKVPHYPMPFTGDIIHTLEDVHECDVFRANSFDSSLSAAMASSIYGRRTFLTSCLPKSLEKMNFASFLRIPLVLVNISRSMVHSIRSDHNDFLAARDHGWLLFAAESNQEILDTVVQAYRISEDNKVMLPSIVNIDGLSNFLSDVQIPTEQSIKKFLPKMRLPHKLTSKQPVGMPLDDYQDMRLQQQKAMENALDVIEKVSDRWKTKFKRSYGLVETYETEDADRVLVMAGYHTATAKKVVDDLREKGEKVGLLRIRVIRPWPAAAVAATLEGKKVGVFDQSISLGAGGILASEVRRHAPCTEFISLGRYLSEADFSSAFGKIGEDKRYWM